MPPAFALSQDQTLQLKFVDAPSSQTAGGLTFRELVFKEESIQTLILTRLAGQSLVASCRFFPTGRLAGTQ